MLSFFLATRLPSALPRDDEKLLALVARGDRAALRKLYDRWSAQVMAVARRVLGAQAEAEEVVQDTFVDVWRRAEQFDAQLGSARGWVLAIARNRAIDRLRQRGAQSRMSSSVQRDEADAPRPPGPLEDVEQRELRERVRAALMDLSPEQRTALELSYYEGLSQSEIAERLGEPLGTVKSRVRLAMEKLANLLAPPLADRRPA